MVVIVVEDRVIRVIKWFDFSISTYHSKLYLTVGQGMVSSNEDEQG